MIEIDFTKYKRKEITEKYQEIINIYNQVRNFILSSNEPYIKRKYLKTEYHIAKNLRNKYYSEQGIKIIKNINNEEIHIIIDKSHIINESNGTININPLPSLTAVIYTVKDKNKNIIWELLVPYTTKAYLTSYEIPKDILITDNNNSKTKKLKKD